MFFTSSSFETSLVDNLGYDGFKRLRHAFDVATGGVADKFDVVVDAGCGTGLVGEQVRVEYLVTPYIINLCVCRHLTMYSYLVNSFGM